MSNKASHKRNRRIRGGALWLTSILMVGSAAVRVAIQAGPALAKETPHEEDAPIVQTEPVETYENAGKAPHAPADLQILVTALQERKRKLDQREAQIEDRVKALEIASGAIDRKLKALVEAEERLGATLALADGASEDDLTRLTDVYEKMKPKDVAALFEEMEPGFAAGFLARMRPDAAAGVMAGLSPKVAYTISVVLAGRNASVPKK